MIKKFLIACFVLLIACCLSLLIYLYGPLWFKKVPATNSSNESIGTIALPAGYERVGDNTGFATYLRNLPLAADSAQVRRITGQLVDSLLPYCYRVIDLPLLHRYEQCADVCIRLRAEYLFWSRQFWKIHFEDTQYNTMRYYWGGRRSKFVPYLIYVFKYANTESLIYEMPQRSLSEIQPGDLFVYSAKDREDKKYGHAIMVADVAINPATGRKIFLLLQGSTPACSIHILKNRNDSVLSPWFELDDGASTLDLGTATYSADELRYFSNSIFSPKDPRRATHPTNDYETITTDSIVPKEVSVLMEAYPQQQLKFRDNMLFFPDGSTIQFDDGYEKTFEQLLDYSDVEDMFRMPYCRTDTPAYLADAGRSRCDAFFKKMYGASADEVKQNLVYVDWVGKQVKFTKVNGAAEQLKKVAAELAQNPELAPYLPSAGTFYWRQVRGAQRQSAHSYGIAIDINTEYSNYWLWTNQGASELDTLKYENRIPSAIVDIFERHGFIWGGRWYHYDTMHFEYRPEILGWTTLAN